MYAETCNEVPWGRKNAALLQPWVRALARVGLQMCCICAVGYRDVFLVLNRSQPFG
jgi:hypothetical protein